MLCIDLSRQDQTDKLASTILILSRSIITKTNLLIWRNLTSNLICRNSFSIFTGMCIQIVLQFINHFMMPKVSQYIDRHRDKHHLTSICEREIGIAPSVTDSFRLFIFDCDCLYFRSLR